MKLPPALSDCLFDLLDLLADAAFFASRPSLGRMSRYWGYTEMRSAYRAFDRWESRQYLEAVRHGDRILYHIGNKGKVLLEHKRPSPTARKRKWDRRWRMVVFDFPETARKARDAFRRALRDQHMGCLQKSVWISPDPIIPAWKHLLQETELTEWVLLFESAELGPVSDTDIALRVWPIEELDISYRRHVSTMADLPRRMRTARMSDLESDLGRAVRRESRAYFDLLRRDPLLPSVLMPSDFAGFEADRLHAEVREELRRLLLQDKP